MNEIIKSLIRVLPFVIILIVLKVRIKQNKITVGELDLQYPNSIKKSLVWCVSFLIFCLITEYILYKNEILEVSKRHSSFIPSIIKVFGMVIIAPIAEELLYRGLFLNKLLALKINKHLAIFLLALLFVGVHSFAYENTFSSKIGIIQTFIDASLFAYARFSTKSIYTPIIMHITGNLIATLEIFLL
jgi:membrane protease YdiL (CAAX protease family)